MQFLYNENREVVAEKDYSGNIIRYIRGLGLISSDSENAKTYYHYVCDEQGSVSRIIRGEDKENGAAAQDKVSDRVLNHYEYDAFGNTISCEERVANRFRYQTSYGKSIENTEFFKENGGLDASDYISIHSRKHMYDPDTVSTPKKTQYGKDVNVGKLCEDTIMKPDEVIYNKDQNVMIYKKEYPFNISTSDTPTGTHRVFIPLNTQGKKTIRMSQFPLVGGN